MDNRTSLRAMLAPWAFGVELMLRRGKTQYAQITFVEMPENTCVESSFRLDENEAQTLMDDLWHAGFRPTEGSGSAGSLKATENHLADMRKIAFKKLGIDR